MSWNITDRYCSLELDLVPTQADIEHLLDQCAREFQEDPGYKDIVEVT